MKLKFFILFLISNLLSGQNSKADPNLLQRIEALERRIANLEKANSQTQQDLSLVEKKADDAKSASEYRISLPQNENEKKSFMSKLRFELDSNEVNAKGPWTKKETWKQIKKNFSEYKVRTILGNPTMIKSSLDPRVSRVYHYVGDLDADGLKEKGFVNFYKGRTTLYKSPF